jgi:prepilin-type N-terminal cleavage/methylation domain-containing protein
MPMIKVLSMKYLVFRNLIRTYFRSSLRVILNLFQYPKMILKQVQNDGFEIDPKRGFTLMELVVVMAILAILSTGGVATYVRSLKRGRDAQRKSDLAQVQKALETYFNDKNSYPDSNATGQIVACSAGACVWGTDGLEDISVPVAVRTVYMKLLPKDPVSAQKYFYTSDGLSYQLYAKLENDDDLQAVSTYTTNCGSATCNYGVSSSNTTP